MVNVRMNISKKRNDLKRFIKSSVLFVALAIVILLALNFSYIEFVLKYKNIYRSEVQYQDIDSRLDIVFMGASLTANGIIPSYIPNSHNYAVPSETYEQTYYKFRKVIAEHDIEAITIPLHITSFGEYRSNPYSDVWYWSEVLPSNMTLELMQKSFLEIVILKNFPFIAKGSEFVMSNQKKKRTMIVDGWYKSDMDFSDVEDKEKRAALRVRAQTQNFPEVINPGLLRGFYNILDLAEKKNIKVFLIRFPETEFYSKALNDIYNTSVYYDELKTNISAYDNAFILDYSDLIENLSMYTSPDHLNRWGAQVLSRQISEDIGW